MRVVECFTTVCGETHLAGLPCALIRFAGCDLRCSWCDTIYARSEQSATREATVADLIRWVDQQGLELVLLTGGEPLLQPELPELAAALVRKHQVLVETSGAHDVSSLAPPVIRSVDIKCPSSRQAGTMCWDNLHRLRPGDCVKFVVADRKDYEYARSIIHTYVLGSPINVLLSPAHPHLKPEELAAWLVEDRLAARLNVQLHRFWPQLERR